LAENFIEEKSEFCKNMSTTGSALVAASPVPGTTSVPLSKSTDLPVGSAMLFFSIFLIIIIGLLIWIVLMHETLNNQDLANNQSPLCLGNTSPAYPTVTCPTGTNLLNVQLNPNENPNTSAYETLNYCSINAPPTSFVQSLELCAGIIDSSQANVGDITIPPMTSSGVTTFADFYNNNYIQTCGYSWKNPPPPLSGQTTAQNDPVLIALVGCARNLGVSNDPNVSQLATICGSDCNPPTSTLLTLSPNTTS